MIGEMIVERDSLSARILDTAMALKMALVEIHPAVEQNGLTSVSELVVKMKRDVDDISARARAAQGVDGLSEDLNCLGSELARRLYLTSPSEMNQKELLETQLAAEMFAERNRKYLQYRKDVELKQGGCDGLG